jgi:serine/threonine protein kinase
MEYINNGDIKGYIAAYQNMQKKIPEEELWELFYQCILGLFYIHGNNIIHRDIKPANLFMTDNKTIKIGDFGVSAIRKKREINYQNLDNTFNLPKETLMIGTPLYMSPEMYNHQEYGSKVDVYALGCTFYEMCYFSPPRIPIPIMNPKGEIITDLQNVTPKQTIGNYSKELLDLINWMIEKDEKKRPSSSEVLETIKNHYGITNSSIGCVFRCLFTYQSIIQKLKKHIPNYNTYEIETEKPITSAYLYAFENDKKNNYNILLNELRNILIFNNPFFEERNEIEPKDLIDFLIKKLHIENNKVQKCGYSRIFTLKNDRDVFDEQKMHLKYKYTFRIYFKSLISDKFYGMKETKKLCLICSQTRYCPESFYYLKVDANEVNKHFINSNNLILDIFKKEIYVQNELFCPICKKYTNHKVCRKIMAISSNLIISLESEEINFDNRNLKYPMDFNLKNIGIGFGTYNLKGVIKKAINNGRIYFVCIYKEMNQWFLSDGVKIDNLNSSSPLNHNIGNIVMLFYSNED